MAAANAAAAALGSAAAPPAALLRRRRRRVIGGALGAATLLVVGSASLLGRACPGPALLGRYHAYQDYGLGSYSYETTPQLSGGSFLLPPIAWLYKDWEATDATCPVLLSLCWACVGGFVVQHCLARFVPFFLRATVFYPPTLKGGEVWRLLTHVLLHSDCYHLVVNLIHILNTLDLEGVVPGTGYPDSYALGSTHTARVAAIAASYGALVGSLTSFGAMFEGASALCFGLDGALLGACGLLLGAGRDPGLAGFLQMRGMYAALHMAMDILRGCNSPGGTIGNVAHVAGFLGGLCYVLAVLPDLGGRAAPTVPCLSRGAGGWQEAQCLAFFSSQYSAPVEQVQLGARAVLALGVLAALANAFVLQRDAHASADGFSLFFKASGRGGGVDRQQQRDAALEAAIRRSMQTHAEEQQRRG